MTAQARAGVPPDSDRGIWGSPVFLVGIGLLPSDLGIFIPNEQPESPDFVLAWSWQWPFSENDRHHVFGGFDWIPTADQRHLRARAGYRYVTDHLVAGFAAAYAASDPTWSPEVGVRLSRGRGPNLHVVARAEIPIAVDGFRGGALLLGWDLL